MIHVLAQADTILVTISINAVNLCEQLKEPIKNGQRNN